MIIILLTNIYNNLYKKYAKSFSLDDIFRKDLSLFIAITKPSGSSGTTPTESSITSLNFAAWAVES
jgi:hypothetical protein